MLSEWCQAIGQSGTGCRLEGAVSYFNIDSVSLCYSDKPLKKLTLDHLLSVPLSVEVRMVILPRNEIRGEITKCYFYCTLYIYYFVKLSTVFFSGQHNIFNSEIGNV